MPADDVQPEPTPTGERREVGLDALKALAHPLRVQLFSTLMALGPATASGLAKELGESSGATSYHLRQLERHGFVAEVEGRGTARERWWRAVPGPYSFGTPEIMTSPAGRAAMDVVQGQLVGMTQQRLADFQHRVGAGEEPQRWFDASTISWVHTFATLAELQDLSDRLEAVATEWRDALGADRNDNVPVGARPIQLELLAFPAAPLADGFGQVDPAADDGGGAPGVVSEPGQPGEQPNELPEVAS